LDQVIAYRQGEALFDPTSFHLAKGEYILIRGTNGAGKTTLLDCIAGIYRNWHGKIQKPKDQVSYLQQGSQFVRTLPLWKLARLTVGFEKGRYRELIERLFLREQEHKLLSLMSGGEMQRSKLLLALLRRHLVLLLDEPFANLDISSYEAIFTELNNTRNERATVIVSHPRDTRESLLTGAITCDIKRTQSGTSKFAVAPGG
jgi:ABC-type multidrug transport system ATPase subunit